METARLWHHRAAREPDIGYAALKRILDARMEVEPLTERLDTSP